jgi:phosphate starvation-inducible membrane PsiE
VSHILLLIKFTLISFGATLLIDYSIYFLWKLSPSIFRSDDALKTPYKIFYKKKIFFLFFVFLSLINLFLLNSKTSVKYYLVIVSIASLCAYAYFQFRAQIKKN